MSGTDPSDAPRAVATAAESAPRRRLGDEPPRLLRSRRGVRPLHPWEVNWATRAGFATHTIRAEKEIALQPSLRFLLLSYTPLPENSRGPASVTSDPQTS